MDEITLRDVYLILRRHLLLVVGLPLLLALTALAYGLTRPDVFGAEATLVVQQSLLQSRLEEKIETSLPPTFSTDELTRIANSQDVLTKVLAALRGDASAAAAWKDPAFALDDLDRHLSVSFAAPASLTTAPGQRPPNPLVILRAEAPDGPTAAITANAWAAATRDALNALPQRRFQGQLDTISGELERAAQRLQRASREYQAFQATTNLEADRSQLDALAEALGREVAAGAPAARTSGLQARLDALRGPVARADLEEERLRAAWRIASSEHEALNKKLSDLRIEMASSTGQAQTLVPAFAPSKPEPKNTMVQVALAAVLGLMLGLILPFVIEAVRDPQAERAAAPSSQWPVSTSGG